MNPKELSPLEIGSKLTNLQAVVIPHLLDGHTIAESAELAGCSESSIKRWLHDPNFQQALTTGRQKAWELAVGKLSIAAEGSVTTLVELRDDEEIPPSIRLKAATAILEIRNTIASQIELDNRLTLLEVNLNG